MSLELKPWNNETTLRRIAEYSHIKSDEDIAEYFVNKGYAVSRRTITDARNKFGIPRLKKEEHYEVEVEELEPPKILFIDIETRPNLGYFWRMYDENIGLNQMVEEHSTICFAAKWRGEDKVHFHSDHTDGHDNMIEAAWKLLDEADFVLHWNGKKFDVPHLNREFILAGLNPPGAFKELDLMLTARSRFRFVSNKLQHISTALGFGGKFQHEGFELWTKCMAGEDEAWATMEHYNKQDVVILEEIYDKILPWIRSHPNVPLYRGVGSCPQCGSSDVSPDGKAYMSTRTYSKFRCGDCGAQMRGLKSHKEKAEYTPLSY